MLCRPRWSLRPKSGVGELDIIPPLSPGHKTHPLGTLALISTVDPPAPAEHEGPEARVARAAHNMRASLFALARQIGDTGEYIGFSAFLLMALSRGVRPKMWIGERCDDIVHLYAPQFAPNCIFPCAYEGVRMCST